jgi:hypothetical protein
MGMMSPAPLPDGSNGATHPAFAPPIPANSDLQASAGRPEAGEAAPDDDQPMLDLRFPEPQDSARPAGSDFPGQPSPAPPEFGRDTADGPPPEAPPAEAVVEVSPIFSALDAADRVAQTQHAHAPADAAPPSLLLPRSLAFMTRPSDTPAEEAPAAVPEVAAPASDPQAEPLPDTAPDAQEDAAAQASPDQQPTAADQLHDAAAKIAEEANATAEALESLKQLLNHKLPLLDTMPAPEPGADAGEPPRAAPPLPAYHAPVQQPVSPPPMLPLAVASPMTELVEYAPARRSRMPMGGFLAGFGLSWVFGAVLYAYLTMG